MSADTPSLGQVLADLEAAIKGSIFTAIPATVVTYDPVGQTVTAKPSISARLHEESTGALIPVPLPVVPGIPVLFPRGAAGVYSITWPLAPGDDLFLIMADRGTDEWKSTGLPENIPLDTRRFDLTDAFAIPGGSPVVRPLPPTATNPAGMVISGPSIQIGSNAAVGAPVVESLLIPVLSALQLWLDTHVHTGVTAGPVSSGPPAVGSPSPPAAGSISALKTRIE